MQNPRHLSMKIRAHVKREIFNLVGTVDSLDLPSVSFQDIPFNKIPAKLRHRRYKQPAILTALDSKVKLLLKRSSKRSLLFSHFGGAPIFF